MLEGPSDPVSPCTPEVCRGPYLRHGTQPVFTTHHSFTLCQSLATSSCGFVIRTILLGFCLPTLKPPRPVAGPSDCTASGPAPTAWGLQRLTSNVRCSSLEHVMRLQALCFCHLLQNRRTRRSQHTLHFHSRHNLQVICD